MSGKARYEGPAVMRMLRWLKPRLARLKRYDLVKRLDFYFDSLKFPTHLYHSPLDYSLETIPPDFGPPVLVEGDPIPVPTPECRLDYSPKDDRYYLEWGKGDHDRILELIGKHRGLEDGLAILDWGCASGRVLRHFYAEARSRGWKLRGVDSQALLVEWMRRNFPPEIEVFTTTTYPHLPFKDSSLDVLYGISVFTHTKYLWDMWLAEFKRVLKPGGLCIQTIQCEPAWRFYHEHKAEGWIKMNHPSSMLEKPDMDEDYYLYGNAYLSQTFFKEEAIKRYWGRHMSVVDFLPPPAGQYQNWVVLKNDHGAP